MKYPIFCGQEICFYGYSIANKVPQIYSITIENFKGMSSTISCICEDTGKCKMVLHTENCVPWELKDELD
jgi:hypothetical protein